MFSLFFKNNQFSNKEGKPNYIMPFTAEELGCNRNDLNVLFDEKSKDLFQQQPEQPFDFREFLAQFRFSEEAKALYRAALEVFKYYHRSEDYDAKDYNDSFYDICNAIMGKETSTYKTLDSTEKRITKVKTTKGTRGFSRTNIPFVVPSHALPVFQQFFDKRDALARKINRQLLDSHLLLWERQNIF